MTEHLLLFGGPIITAVITWIFARRKNLAEARGVELENAAKIVRMWRDLSEGMETRFRTEISDLQMKNCELQKKMEDITRENEMLLNKMHSLEDENRKLQAQLKIFNRKNYHHEQE